MIVFVAGLSRSGKTSRSRHAASAIQNVEYVSVSQMLVEAGRDLSVRTIRGALENQESAMGKLSTSPLFGYLHRLIDGHALIETGEGPMLVPDQFFDEIRPQSIISVQDSPELILSRRMETPSASRLQEIAALAVMERAACARTAARLGIPLVELMAPSVEQFTEALRQQLM
ncbi:hypothetical protein RPMA_03860 [Tardiphaga alba]|uniref:Adenylate kinase n=1 Tax=Tardiphaga alba TaxID=340268 RepID=A0ABX8A733_9BRAD|nr:hypothetical protein [Tardiphaga alba]QUS38085.1 hypothetical protein RPMA_03860 [Tardiphaga alba]